MKKFLTDKEIMKWNDIVKNYIIKSYDGRYSSVPDILKVFESPASASVAVTVPTTVVPSEMD